ncbi:hypothetical protein E6C48_22415 [Mesorhizobium composti]|uniref:Transposase n=1 Tax=Ollibium composti TaxID=2675109 RepID=A0ABY2Q0M4_9HYPH|nr:hypothetical protein E6C48_22415 [Mesorhizobium composti]
MQRRKFSREFKLEAVRLVKDRGHRPQRARRRKPPLDQNLRPKPYMKAGHFSAKIPGQLSAEINSVKLHLRTRCARRVLLR